MSFIDGLKSTEERRGEKPCCKELSVPGSGTIASACQADGRDAVRIHGGSPDVRSTGAGSRAAAGCIPHAGLVSLRAGCCRAARQSMRKAPARLASSDGAAVPPAECVRLPVTCAGAGAPDRQGVHPHVRWRNVRNWIGGWLARCGSPISTRHTEVPSCRGVSAWRTAAISGQRLCLLWESRQSRSAAGAPVAALRSDGRSGSGICCSRRGCAPRIPDRR